MPEVCVEGIPSLVCQLHPGFGRHDCAPCAGIDDTWEGDRDAQGNIHPNKKFPDMKALADYVHGKGLKLGIYSSPGPNTCAGYEGSYRHEEQDAQAPGPPGASTT